MMPQQPLISVIVPVYNVASYLVECLESIREQTYSNIELILVDDGSTDGSGVICDGYADVMRNTHVIHKGNGGLSSARNAGLQHCHGDYVAFIDGDDVVSPLFIEALYEAVRQSNSRIGSVPCGIVFKDGEKIRLLHKDSKVLEEHKIEILDDKEFIRRLLYQRIETGVPWRLYKRDILGENPFPIGIYYEDLATVYRIAHRAGSVALLPEKRLYAYRMRQGSIQHNDNYERKVDSVIVVATQLYEDIVEWYPDLANAASSRCFSACRNVFAQMPKQSEGRMFIWRLLSEHRKAVLFDNSARTKERLAASIAFLGQFAFSGFCTLCRKIGLMI